MNIKELSGLSWPRLNMLYTKKKKMMRTLEDLNLFPLQLQEQLQPARSGMNTGTSLFTEMWF